MDNATNGTTNGTANGTALGFAGRVFYNACPGNAPERIRAATGEYLNPIQLVLTACLVVAVLSVVPQLVLRAERAVLDLLKGVSRRCCGGGAAGSAREGEKKGPVVVVPTTSSQQDLEQGSEEDARAKGGTFDDSGDGTKLWLPGAEAAAGTTTGEPSSTTGEAKDGSGRAGDSDAAVDEESSGNDVEAAKEGVAEKAAEKVHEIAGSADSR